MLQFSVMSTLAEYLNQRLQDLDWSQRELARRANMSSGQVSNVIGGGMQAGADFCVAVAHALNEPPEHLLRLAGILPPSSAEIRQQHPRLDYVFRLLADMYHKEPSHFDAVVFMVEAVANVKPSAKEPGPEPTSESPPQERKPGIEFIPAAQPATETGGEPVDRFGLDQFEALYDLYIAQFGDEEGHRRFRRVIERFEEDRQRGEGRREEGENSQAARRERPDA